MNNAAEPDPVWTNDDWMAGHCSCAEIGISKYESRKATSNEQSTSLDVLSALSLDPTLDTDLVTRIRDAHAIAWALAEAHPGGLPGYYRDNPDFHKRMLLLSARIPVKPPEKSSMTLNIAWINPNGQRLSYRQELEKATEVEPKDQSSTDQ